jgi:hypothetical protein
MPRLTEIQRIPTTGARAVEPIVLADATRLLAVPQLAVDRPGTPDGINGGSSDTVVALFRDTDDGFVPAGELPVGGGEDVEAFHLDGRHFVAVASIRTGSGPYDFHTTSPIFEVTANGFERVQSFDTIAAKQWRAFEAGGESFLALAQGHPAAGGRSTVYRWDSGSFVPFQEFESAAGYNFASFEIDGATYLAYADHARPAVLARFGGDRFETVQELLPSGGRAFRLIDDGSEHHLAVARIDGDSLLYRWDGERFVDPAVLPGGPGGREFEVVTTPRATYLIRVDFIHGTPADPTPDLLSHVYRVERGRATTVAQFATTGGTDVVVLPGDGPIRIAVSNGLSSAASLNATFAADTVIYRFDDEA